MAWKLGENFWTEKGVRQRCPLNSVLFNILIADIEEEMRRVKWEVVKVQGRKIYTLA